MKLPAKVSVKNKNLKGLYSNAKVSWNQNLWGQFIFWTKSSWPFVYEACFFGDHLSHCWILQWRWLSWWGNYGVDTKCKWSTQMMSGLKFNVGWAQLDKPASRLRFSQSQPKWLQMQRRQCCLSTMGGQRASDPLSWCLHWSNPEIRLFSFSWAQL